MKKLTNLKEIMDELKLSDPQMYEEIQQEVADEVRKWGGKRENAGRKPKTGTVLDFRIRVSEKEKEFIDYARSHNINYDDLMQG